MNLEDDIGAFKKYKDPVDGHTWRVAEIKSEIILPDTDRVCQPGEYLLENSSTGKRKVTDHPHNAGLIRENSLISKIADLMINHSNKICVISDKDILLEKIREGVLKCLEGEPSGSKANRLTFRLVDGGGLDIIEDEDESYDMIFIHDSLTLSGDEFDVIADSNSKTNDNQNYKEGLPKIETFGVHDVV